MDKDIIGNVSGLLIAGGKSRRMGQDKRFVKVGGRSVFDRTLALLMATFAENIVVLAEPVDSLDVRGCRVVYDVISNAGSLGGLYTGLLAATQPRVFAVACDMPFVNVKVIRLMLSRNDTADVVAAHLSGRFQPMHAVYSKRCVPFLKAMAERRDLKLQKLLQRDELQIAVLSEDDFLPLQSGLRSFHNINTPDDLALAETPTSVEP